MKSNSAIFLLLLLMVGLNCNIWAKGEAEWEREQNHNRMKTEWEDLSYFYPGYDQCKPDFTKSRNAYKAAKYIATTVFRLLIPFTLFMDAVVDRQSFWLCFKGNCLKNQSKEPSLEDMRSFVRLGLGTCGDYLDQNFLYSCQRWDDPSSSGVNRCNNPCTFKSPDGLYNSLYDACNNGFGGGD